MSSSREKRLQDVLSSVSRETVDNLLDFEALFRKWSKAINLASPSTLDQLWERHIVDSAQLFDMAPNALKWLDLGSGGGFPGIVLAILLKQRAGAGIDLVESNGKKAAFLRTAIGRFSAPATVHAMRIDAAWARIATPDVITARALAPLSGLFTLAEPWLKQDSVGLFQKGRDYRREIEESRDAWSFDLVERVSAVDKDSVVLQVSHLRRKDTNQ
ncbi:16S rRNA (guanine(527)-N(7))-methyltransferase RsmG [Phyllobacterium zundukense]|uniref:16S rRNA (Guanine(527)-N(7))-methyltransferase RsmG n=1 Tax=Phyllobacterium zundukense TaxID=1867719 RepID=A0ACD4D806_9HYPH|nr:16S rRNA (guanine(527)-N(7))-methyltransferase RsmG [Phyllobacterium zundukense]UXN61894.1 16S rRNA (guanine(527)-N(7))-methyltransferase RsmG [Phyllobacterium zundukense]